MALRNHASGTVLRREVGHRPDRVELNLEALWKLEKVEYPLVAMNWLGGSLRLDRDAFQRDLATTWRRIKGKPTPTNKKAMQRSDFSGELTPEQIAYAASDAVMAFQVWEACRTEGSAAYSSVSSRRVQR